MTDRSPRSEVGILRADLTPLQMFKLSNAGWTPEMFWRIGNGVTVTAVEAAALIREIKATE